MCAFASALITELFARAYFSSMLKNAKTAAQAAHHSQYFLSRSNAIKRLILVLAALFAYSRKCRCNRNCANIPHGSLYFIIFIRAFHTGARISLDDRNNESLIDTGNHSLAHAHWQRFPGLQPFRIAISLSRLGGRPLSGAPPVAWGRHSFSFSEARQAASRRWRFSMHDYFTEARAIGHVAMAS